MLRVQDIFVRVASAYRLPIAAAIVATTFGVQNASAANISYTGFSLIGDNIHITAPHDVSGEAGQIKLTGVTGYTSNTILAWCLDIYDFLQGSGTYAPGGQLPAPNNSNKIGGLMLEGNAYIALGGSQTIGGHTYSQSDISAATQVALWSVEYGGLSYFINGAAPTSDFKALVTYLENNAALDVAYSTLTDADGSPKNQTLGTLSPVPGPILGGGVPGLVAAAGGLFGWWRRKRNPVGAA